jgi:hypothetical protein
VGAIAVDPARFDERMRELANTAREFLDAENTGLSKPTLVPSVDALESQSQAGVLIRSALDPPPS